MSGAAFAGFPLERAIEERARLAGVDLPPGALAALASHARAVIEANAVLRLTTIVEPAAFVERHIGESLEGAAMVPADIAGTALDLGSGNGYPGLPLAAVRPGLKMVLAESSARKAAFLAEVIAAKRFPSASVFAVHVDRPGPVEPFRHLAVLATRAVGGWERVVPRLAAVMGEGGAVLVWAGTDMEAVRRRTSWRPLRLEDRRALPGRDRSWIWRFSVPRFER